MTGTARDVRKQGITGIMTTTDTVGRRKQGITGIITMTSTVGRRITTATSTIERRKQDIVGILTWTMATVGKQDITGTMATVERRTNTTHQHGKIACRMR